MERKQTMEHTSLLVLSLLQGQDLYGYQMITELERRSDHTFQMKERTLYPVLKKLESEGITFNGVDGVDASVLTDPAEQALIRLLAAFPAEIVAAADKYDPARITRYCIDVASAYHRFYNACRIKGEEHGLLASRLKLADTVRAVLANGLGLLGVSAPEKM